MHHHTIKRLHVTNVTQSQVVSPTIKAKQMLNLRGQI